MHLRGTYEKSSFKIKMMWKEFRCTIKNQNSERNSTLICYRQIFGLKLLFQPLVSTFDVLLILLIYCPLFVANLYLSILTFIGANPSLIERYKKYKVEIDKNKY